MSKVFPTESLASCSGIWVKVTIFSELAFERSMGSVCTGKFANSSEGEFSIS
jgi:hypothetical protein